MVRLSMPWHACIHPEDLGDSYISTLSYLGQVVLILLIRLLQQLEIDDIHNYVDYGMF